MQFKSDIEIAQGCEMKPIRDIAASVGVTEDYQIGRASCRERV